MVKVMKIHHEDNLMSLCKSCHSKITASEGGRWGWKQVEYLSKKCLSRQVRVAIGWPEPRLSAETAGPRPSDSEDAASWAIQKECQKSIFTLTA